MYVYCLDCDVKETIMWIKFEKKRRKKVWYCHFTCDLEKWNHLPVTLADAENNI